MKTMRNPEVGQTVYLEIAQSFPREGFNLPRGSIGKVMDIEDGVVTVLWRCGHTVSYGDDQRGARVSCLGVFPFSHTIPIAVDRRIAPPQDGEEVEPTRFLI